MTLIWQPRKTIFPNLMWSHGNKKYAELFMGTLGERVRECREEKNWSQGELADEVTRLGFPLKQQSVYNIESRGQNRPQCLWELSVALGVEERWLIKGQGPKYRTQGNIVYDAELLRFVVSGVEDSLLKQPGGSRATPSAKAEMVQTLYEYFAVGDEANADLNRAQVIDLHTKLRKI